MLHIYDGHNFCHRHYHGMPRLTNKKGEPVGMLVGAAAALHKLMEKPPSRVAFLFDKGKCHWRRELVPTYKAARERVDDLEVQIPIVQEMVEAYGFHTWWKPGVEADDLIGTLAKIGSEKGPVEIYTSDKDMNQLVRKNVSVVHPDGKHMTPKEVKSTYGVSPLRFADYLALVGDKADGYPGLAGCGNKTAADLINTYGGINEILSASLSPKHAKLISGNEQHLLTQLKVAKIKRNVKITFSLKDCVPKTPDFAKLAEMFDLYELPAARARVEKYLNRPKGLFS